MRTVVLSFVLSLLWSSPVAAQFAVVVDDSGVLVGSVFGEDRVLVELDGVLAKADIDPVFGEYVPVSLATQDIFYRNAVCNSPQVRSTAAEAGLLVATGSQWGVTGQDANPVGFGFLSQRNGAGNCQSISPPAGLLLYEIDSIDTQLGFDPPLTVEIRDAGDLNGDGVADIVDVTILRRQLAGLTVNL